MWFRKCTGVLAMHFPVPSISMDTDTFVSFVFLSTYPLRTARANVSCATGCASPKQGHGHSKLRHKNHTECHFKQSKNIHKMPRPS
jgi:hypothetical protein